MSKMSTVTLLGAKGEHVAIKSDIGEVVEVVVPGIFASRGQHRYRRQSLRQVVASRWCRWRGGP